jgi:serine/threonine protein kinase/tetratricopeptide (TPR) repeat protein
MPSLLYRICEALLPDYEVERELASGGMGTVFLARDVTLDRQVAIKIVRPELATADATERFLREARLLASLGHPNIVPIHRAGEARGFTYYVMDFVEGETLAGRLREGTMSPIAVVKLGRDMLDALEQVHKLGIVHRDIKPANIFLLGGRALLGDFGISTKTESKSAVGTTEGKITGTPGYMPPEQAFGWEVTPRTDLYAVGMVLYEALTGRRWQSLIPEQPADWSGIPGPIARVLRRALFWDSNQRWADAAAFRRALWRTRTRKYRQQAFYLAMGTLAAGILGALLLPKADGTLGPPADLAILPFDVGPGVDPSWSEDIPQLINSNLSTVTIVPLKSSFGWHAPDGDDGNAPFEALHTRTILDGTIERDGENLVVSMELRQRGVRQPLGAHLATPLAQISDYACRLSHEVLRLVAPDKVPDFSCNLALEDEAMLAYLAGERAFREQAWGTAANEFKRALEVEPEFTLAQWRLIRTLRWLREPVDVDREQLWHQRHQLSEINILLLDAWRTPFGPGRLEKYDSAVNKHPRDPYAWLDFGNELFHRGALLEIPLDSALAVYREALRWDSAFGPALLELFWGETRLGRPDSARAALDRLKHISPPEALVPTWLLEFVYAERFGTAGENTQELMEQLGAERGWSADLDTLVWQNLRWGTSFDIPATQVALAEGLLTIPGIPRDQQVNVREARGLALVALGRWSEALAEFDAVTEVSNSNEAALQAAQWRVVPQALGIPGVAPREIARGRSELERLAQGGAMAARARWTLGVDAAFSGNAPALATARRRLRLLPDTSATQLATSLSALQLGASDDVRSALTTSDSLTPFIVANLVTDPFLRSVHYLKRYEWRTQLDDRDAARELQWHEGSDIRSWPKGFAQAGEIDWALGTHARFLVGKDEVTRGDHTAGCRTLRRVLEHWAHADAALDSVRQEADEMVRERCPT